MVSIRFRGVVRPGPRGGALVVLPDEATRIFATRARLPVKATFNDIPYRGSALPVGDGTLCLGITKAIRAEAGIAIGDEVEVMVERDDGERTVDVPEALAAALGRAGLAELYEQMAFTHRKEYARWVAEAKTPATRTRRVERAVTMIARGERLS
jgi:hypothetical protein